MKILIEINDDIYEHAKESSEDSRDEFDAVRAIVIGTPIKQSVFDKISDEIEADAFNDVNGVLYVSLNHVKKILKKYKGGDNDGK